MVIAKNSQVETGLACSRKRLSMISLLDTPSTQSPFKTIKRGMKEKEKIQTGINMEFILLGNKCWPTLSRNRLEMLVGFYLWIDVRSS